MAYGICIDGIPLSAFHLGKRVYREVDGKLEYGIITTINHSGVVIVYEVTNTSQLTAFNQLHFAPEKHEETQIGFFEEEV